MGYLEHSELSRVIAPEIKGDAFYDLIRKLAATEKLENVLEIGSSSGGGSTEAFVTGLAQNPGQPRLFCIEVSKPRFQLLRETYRDCPFVYCYNRSTIRAEHFPAPQKVAEFYRDVPSALRKFPLPLVLDWLRRDVEYVRGAGVEADAIEQIKADHEIQSFDMVLIDGSEFTGELDFSKVNDAKLVLLGGTTTFKCHGVRERLLNDPMYDLIAEDLGLRNGYAAFRRRPTPRRVGGALPIHFFTIVLNGEPFIRYHAEVFRKLTVPWHWHVIEGVASLKHDTAWSVAQGGHVAGTMHNRGRSNDGTSAYLDDVAAQFPDNVTIYRKPLDEFWDGKREMTNAPLPNIRETCLLWEVDSDELWTSQQIETVHRMFTDDPDRSAAYYWCWYYVGPDKIISTRYNYALNPNQEWLRTWRFRPGAVWAAHEPPRLTISDEAGNATDLAGIKPFTHDEMEQRGVVFHHFAYATEDQLRFKEQYYGYKRAVGQWMALQAHSGPGALKEFFSWVSDNTIFDDIRYYLVEPIARFDRSRARWSFDGAGVLPECRRKTAVKRPRIAVDGVFWQYLSSGIGRVWSNLLREWVATGFAEHVVLLDRAGTAPRIPGVHYWTIARHDYSRSGQDSLYLENVCRQLDADMFASTYYSTPTVTPSFFVGYDMIPELLGVPLRDETWREKQRAIMHACAHSMISRNSARDLEATHSFIPSGSTFVTHCGVDPQFRVPSQEEVDAFLSAYGLKGKPYALMVGERVGFHGYKNGLLAFRAMAALPAARSLTLVCIGGHEEIEQQLREVAPHLDVRRFALRDDELCAAYAAAHALLYPSKYEGFGMPPLESMACGTPPIVCRNSSLPEVAGDAALYVDENDPQDMTAALVKLFDFTFRADLVARGFKQAAQFTFASMARRLAEALLASHAGLEARRLQRPSAAWTELRGFQQACQAHTIDVTLMQSATVGEGPVVETVPGRELEEARAMIAAMRHSPFWKARELAVRLLRQAGLRSRG